MAHWLSKKELELYYNEDSPYPVQNVGTDEERWRHDHRECCDSRGRMYWTLKATTWLVFCHNCQGKGVYREEEGDVVPSVRKEVNSVRTHNVIESGPWGIECSVSHRLYKHHIDRALHRYTPMLCTDTEGLLRWTGDSAVFHMDGIHFLSGNREMTFGGTSIRNFRSGGYHEWTWDPASDPDVTEKRTTGKMVPCLYYDTETGPRSDLLVIVEDPVSGICVTQTGEADALVLFGTHVTSEQLHATCLLYANVVVWLDGDNRQVMEAELEIVKTVSLFHRSVEGFNYGPMRKLSHRRVADDSPKHDPKYMTSHWLKTHLSYRNGSRPENNVAREFICPDGNGLKAESEIALRLIRHGLYPVKDDASVTVTHGIKEPTS